MTSIPNLRKSAFTQQNGTYNGTLAVGSPVAGTGAAIDMGTHTGTGSYNVVAMNASTGCMSNMSGSASIGINPLPNAYTVTGGGSYCNGSTGIIA